MATKLSRDGTVNDDGSESITEPEPFDLALLIIRSVLAAALFTIAAWLAINYVMDSVVR